jgi:hypothetical protein
MDDNEQYAKLLASIKIANTGLRRPLSPFETAQFIQRLIDEEGYELAEELIPIKTKLISDFLQLLKLPEQCHDAIHWGVSEDLSVGFSSAAFIAGLDKKNDQISLFNEASKQSLGANDIKDIISFYKKHDLPLNDVIEKITSSKPQVITTFLVVISIHENIRKQISELSKKHNKTFENILREKFREKLNVQKIENLISKGKNIAVSFNAEEYKNYKNQIKKLCLNYDKITEYLVS